MKLYELRESERESLREMPEIRVVSNESCLRTLMAHELLREMRVVSIESLRQSLRERVTGRTARDTCRIK